MRKDRKKQYQKHGSPRSKHRDWKFWASARKATRLIADAFDTKKAMTNSVHAR